MKVSFKYFQYRSIKLKKVPKYAIPNNGKYLCFNNHIHDFEKALSIFLKIQKTIEYMRERKWQEIRNDAKQKKNWDLLDTNSSVEAILLVLMGFGLNRDFIINNIFGGYNSSYKGTNNQTLEKLLGPNNFIIKTPISVDIKNKERMFFLFKKDQIFPLFIDVNHDLFTTEYFQNPSSKKLESVYNHILFKSTKK